MARGKKLEDAYKEIDVKKKYTLVEAINLTKKLCPTKKFDASVEVSIRLGVDPKQSDQQVRSTVVMPHGTGKKVRVLVFAQGDKERDAQEAGADYVGSAEFVDKVKAGWTDFDACVATPDMMKVLAPLGKVLGPRGLMPNPKLGTVTFDVGKAVRELKAGKIEFRVEKAGIVHAPIGKASFGEAQLLDNFLAFFEAVNKAKPSTTKGTYMRACSVSSTMGPGIRVDLGTVKKITA